MRIKPQTAPETDSFRIKLSCLPQNQDQAVWLIKSKEGVYTPSVKKLEAGEEPTEAAKNFCYELTGWEDAKVELLDASSVPAKTGEIRLIFKALGGQDFVPKEKGKWLQPTDWLKRQDLSPDCRISLRQLEGGGLEEIHNRYLRALSDYQNLLKRTAREKLESAKYAGEQVIIGFLPVYDNLKIALEHADENANRNGWLEGVRHIARQFKDVLADLGVSEIEALGERFDPHFMEAAEGKGDIVARVVRPGYRLHGKIIVPARVIITETEAEKVA